MRFRRKVVRYSCLIPRDGRGCRLDDSRADPYPADPYPVHPYPVDVHPVRPPAEVRLQVPHRRLRRSRGLIR
jgi:hypothetical protein